jgi:proteasome lid subunit RPN8/RPN11
VFPASVEPVPEPAAPAPRLSLSAAAERFVRERAGRGHPHEVCGVLVGRASRGRVEVVRAEIAGNLDQDRPRDRYLLDPGDFVRIDAVAREEGLDVIGIWHSHPDHPARPSVTDRERAWEGWAYVIVSVGWDGVRELRSWWLLDGEFVEQAVEVVP